MYTVCICHLEAWQLIAVVHTHWLDLWRFAVQVSVVQSFHLTLLIAEPSRDFLSGYGFDQVLTLREAMKHRHEICFLQSVTQLVYCVQ